MRRKMAMSACLGLLAGLVAAPSAHAVPEVTLWVVQPPGQLVAFDPADLSRIGGVRIPALAYYDPRRLAVNGHGQFLLRLDDDHLWLWDGERASTPPVSPTSAPDLSAFTRPGMTPTRQWFLGDDGNTLYVVESVTRDDGAADSDSSRTPLRMLETDLLQQPRREVFARTVGRCFETMRLVAFTRPCPDPEVWAPGGVIRGCAVFTQWEQLREGDESRAPMAAGERSRYLRGARGWRPAALGRTWHGESLLDISPDGSHWVTSQSDVGCCGWLNASSEQAMFVGTDSTAIVFDEWPAFGNEGYDVSFFTADARIGPDADRVALCVHATQGPAAPIGPSANARTDSLQVRRLREELTTMPMVVIVQVRPRRAETLRIPNAELIGWLNRSEVLVVEDGRIVAVDVSTGKRRRSGITVRTAADAIMVWR